MAGEDTQQKIFTMLDLLVTRVEEHRHETSSGFDRVEQRLGNIERRLGNVETRVEGLETEVRGVNQNLERRVSALERP